MEIQLREINTQISEISDNKYMEIYRKNYIDQEEAQEGKISERNGRKLQKKRDAERNKYRQITGEEKVSMLHKSRITKRNKRQSNVK
jgi:hypothetical protein